MLKMFIQVVLVMASVFVCSGYELDGPALPNRPWVSIWNGPTNHCEKFGIHINLSHFDIVQNPNDNFTGQFMTIFYKLGYFPRLLDDGTVVNGGIPQLANLSLHLNKAKVDIETTIPDFYFQGLAVIDFESYKPIWEENWDALEVYRKLSRDLVKKRHPDWSKDRIETVAKYEFEFAARVFMLQTLKLAEKLRPTGHWGYYHYPYCFDYNKGQLHCEERFRKLNDAESWLFMNSQALYPSIYLSGKHPPSERWKIMHAIIEEAFRIAHKKKHQPVFPYTKFQYNERVPFWFYSEEDLRNSLTMSADFGSAGSIIWSPSGDFVSSKGCKLLQTFVDRHMGPIVRRLTEFTIKCSRERCSNHGRCVKRALHFTHPRNQPDHDPTEIRDNRVLYFKSSPYDDYECHCYERWHGNRCEKKIS